MKERDFKRWKARFMKQERNRRRGKAASENATSIEMETSKNRKGRLGAERKPRRSAVKKEGANKRTIEERERLQMS